MHENKFKPIELKRVNDDDVVSLKKNINELEIDLKHLLLTLTLHTARTFSTRSRVLLIKKSFITLT